jgi:tetratricopeptide (TPR) repeat protein
VIALRALHLGRAPALEHAEPVLKATVLAYSRDVRDVEVAGWAFARLGRHTHAPALAAALDGDFVAAGATYDRILDANPRDTLALWAAQLIDYFLGNSQVLGARARRVLPHWSERDPEFHFILSTLAFGLEECGDYAAAEAAARRALELEPQDLRAEHALLHVLEMQGRAAEGLQRAAPATNHLWWHRALFHLQLGDAGHALDVYDRHMRLATVADLIDASSLLWRLRLAGVDLGRRFAVLAEHWAPFAEDGYCAFNDLHAAMAFAGAGRWTLAERLQAAQARRIAAARGANYDMTRLVGLPACRALVAFGRGDYARAESLLRALPPVAHRLGGSHAQRDVLTLTRAAAAARRFPAELHAPRLLAAA